MTIGNLIREERNWQNISVLTCHGYKCKSKNPRSKSRYRDIVLGIPHWKNMPFDNGYLAITEMWLESHTPLTELYNRWHLLAIDDMKLIAHIERSCEQIVTYKIHDKYNIMKLMTAHLKQRMPLFY